MFYQMRFDMDSIDELLTTGKSFIYAEDDNLDEIVFDGIKKGFFNTIILKNREIESWPHVEFYYSSKASDRESDYLLNASSWPLVHANVKVAFETNGIGGVSFYPVKLIDVVTKRENNDYYLLFVNNFIDAYDMAKSEFKHNKRYGLYTFIPNKTYLDINKCSSFDIFRCNHSSAIIYVSQKVVDLIIKNDFTGFSFIPQR